jgi:hypothetical protein
MLKDVVMVIVAVMGIVVRRAVNSKGKEKME